MAESTDQSLKKRFARIIQWPRRAIAKPDNLRKISETQYRAIARHVSEIEQQKHDEESRHRERVRIASIRWALVVLSLITVPILITLYTQRDELNEKREQMNSVEFTIRQHEAQQRLIYGPYYNALKSPHPKASVIPPMDQWPKQGDANGDDQLQGMR